MPKVSIVVPNFNHAGYLRERIDSVLRQTVTDWELILLDDASTDHSVEILREYARLPGVRLDLRSTNSGSPFVQWDRGVALATAPLVWIAESDDVADPRFLERLLPRFERNPRCVLAYCESRRINAAGEWLGLTSAEWPEPARWSQNFDNDGRAECLTHLIWRNTIPNASAVVFRRDAYAASESPRHMRLCGDWYKWASVLTRGDISYVSDPLNHFRTHGSSVRAKVTGMQFFAEQWQVRQHILKLCHVPPEFSRGFARQAMREMGDFKLYPHRRPLSFLRALNVCRWLILRHPAAATRMALALTWRKLRPERAPDKPATAHRS